MMQWLRRLFAPKKKHIVPLFPEIKHLIAAMRAKDAALCGEVGLLTPGMAIQRWREVHPEDFVGIDPVVHTVEDALKAIR